MRQAQATMDRSNQRHSSRDKGRQPEPDYVGRKKTRPKPDAEPIARQFGERLNALLEARKMSVEEYSDALKAAGCKKAKSTIWQIIRGESIPPMKDLPAMAKALGLKHWQDILPPK